MSKYALAMAEGDRGNYLAVFDGDDFRLAANGGRVEAISSGTFERGWVRDEGDWRRYRWFVTTDGRRFKCYSDRSCADEA